MASKSSEEIALQRLQLRLEYLFDRGIDFEHRTIKLSESIDKDTFEYVDSCLSILTSQSRKAITVKINSGGGSVYDALGIVGLLKDSGCKIITEGYGQIMSAATLVLVCGNERRISPYAYFMHHEMEYTLEDGKHGANKRLVAQAEEEEKQWCKWMAKFTKKSANFWQKYGTPYDFYLTPKKLLQYGAVDKITKE